MDPVALLTFSGSVIDHLDVIWTFTLLCARYFAFFTLVPGIGMGERGMMVRSPAIIILAATSLSMRALAAVPQDIGMMFASLVSEYILGALLGLIPMLLIAGVQMAMQLASTSMGIGVGNLVDPTLGMPSSDLSRIIGDISIVLFLLLGGHHVMLYAASGLGGEVIPGTFWLGEGSLQHLLNRSAHVFEIGFILSVPVIVALLLTQFVLGLVTKAVPTVNIFIVSFPLTIGIGLVLAVLAMPDFIDIVSHEFTSLESSAAVFLQDMRHIP
ncbi:MAG: flagellar biosynthetic protein FliR [Oligoflexia bacterium]|nr:flagellar biosynthetic protein FliR [Oligoflexia bacterium]